MSDLERELFGIIEALKQNINILKESGMTYIPRQEHEKGQKNNRNDEANSQIFLDEIRREIGDCIRCKLCHGRTNIVFGVGHPSARLVFVGEGPGAEEDKQGEPFVGRAGQLLTKMIGAMGLSREEVYICNVVKCRPPQNRDPEPDEVLACGPFLKKQLATIKPEIIVGLGRYACQTLLETTVPMSRLRGTWHAYEGIKFMPTFHPAYLLRNPPAKKEAWQDLQAVMEALGTA
jgi:DNA polymerase